MTAAEPQSVMSRPAQTAAPEIRSPAFHCDGRKHCSQMSSCSEAKQFLNNCRAWKWTGMVMAFRASSSCARGLLAGDCGLTAKPSASLLHQRPNADGSHGGKRQDLTPMPMTQAGLFLESDPEYLRVAKLNRQQLLVMRSQTYESWEVF